MFQPPMPSHQLEIDSMVRIKSYPAESGDAFLVNSTDRPFLMLIDGGYAETFQSHIRTDLVNLAANGCQLDLVVATHVDADHVSGLLTFFRQNGYFETPIITPVHEVLHNSLRSLVSPPQGQTTLRPDDAALLQEIRQRGYPLPTAPVNLEQEISARQGNSRSRGHGPGVVSGHRDI